MTYLPPDLQLRTVMFDNDPDQMGVVMSDWREECVKVSFDGGRTQEKIPRDRLTDVTASYDYAHAWGLTEEDNSGE